MLPIKLLHLNSKVPSKSHQSDAGYDCYAPNNVVLLPGKVTQVSLGFCLELPEGELVYCQIASRSGLASRGVFAVGGVIDPGYRGELTVLLYNSNEEDMSISVGDRICQIIFLPYLNTTFQQVPMLSPSSRGANGLGSTGGILLS